VVGFVFHGARHCRADLHPLWPLAVWVSQSVIIAVGHGWRCLASAGFCRVFDMFMLACAGWHAVVFLINGLPADPPLPTLKIDRGQPSHAAKVPGLVSGSVCWPFWAIQSGIVLHRSVLRASLICRSVTAVDVAVRSSRFSGS